MMEQIYNELTNTILPKIQEGLSITKDYFFDLFGRYINYLIVLDSIGLILGLILLVIIIILCAKYFKYTKSNDFDDDTIAPFALFILFLVVICGIFLVTNTQNLVKDVFIPEIRVIEELQKFKSN